MCSSTTFPYHPGHWISRKGNQPSLGQASGIFHLWLKKNKHSNSPVPWRTLFEQTLRRKRRERWEKDEKGGMEMYPRWNEHGGRESKGAGYGRAYGSGAGPGRQFYRLSWKVSDSAERWTIGASVEENQNEGITVGDRRWKGEKSNLVGRGYSKRKPVPVRAALTGNRKGSEGHPSMLPFLSSRVCCLEKYGSGNSCELYPPSTWG